MKTNSNKPLLYTAIGDSLTVGVGSGFAPGFAQTYACLTEKTLHRRVCLSTFARSGATSKDVLKFLENPRVRESIRAASILTISVGGNDLIQAGKLWIETKNESILHGMFTECMRNVSQLLKQIHAIKKAPNESAPTHSEHSYIIRMLDLYNPLTEVPLASRWVRNFNSQLRASSASKPNTRITNLYPIFKGREQELLSADKIHPNPQGYQVIAENLHALGYDHLR